MDRRVIVPETGLLPHRPYSPAILVDDFLFVSGHTGAHPVTREFSDDITEQTRMTFDNIRAVLAAAGAGMQDVVKATVFMTDMSADFQAMNAVFRDVFPDNPPARSTVGVAHLARPGLKVEIEVIAYRRKGAST